MAEPSNPLGPNPVKDVGAILSVIKHPIVQMGIGGIALIMIGVTLIFIFATHLSTLERLAVLSFSLVLVVWVTYLVKETYLQSLRFNPENSK